MVPAAKLWQVRAALPEKLLAFSLFTLIGAITPGPNNTISTVSGATFGFRRTLPQMFGVTFGYPLMLVALGLGLGEVFRVLPWLHNVLRFVGAAFLLYLAWKLARANAPEAAAAAKPVGFIEAVVFQWLNPKAWTLALGAIATFTTPGTGWSAFLWEVGIYAAVSAIVTFPSLAVWCLFGVGIARLLKDDRSRRIVNLSLAALLALSVVFLFL